MDEERQLPAVDFREADMVLAKGPGKEKTETPSLLPGACSHSHGLTSRWSSEAGSRRQCAGLKAGATRAVRKPRGGGSGEARGAADSSPDGLRRDTLRWTEVRGDRWRFRERRSGRETRPLPEHAMGRRRGGGRQKCRATRASAVRMAETTRGPARHYERRGEKVRKVHGRREAPAVATEDEEWR